MPWTCWPQGEEVKLPTVGHLGPASLQSAPSTAGHGQSPPLSPLLPALPLRPALVQTHLFLAVPHAESPGNACACSGGLHPEVSYSGRGSCSPLLIGIFQVDL